MGPGNCECDCVCVCVCWESVAVQPRSLNKAPMNVHERQMDARNMDQSVHLLIMMSRIKPQKLLKKRGSSKTKETKI